MVTKNASQEANAEETQTGTEGIESQEPSQTTEEESVVTPPPFMYAWDAKTFLYVCRDYAQPNPLSPGEYFGRANATFKEINEIKENTRQKWNVEAEIWEYIPDYTNIKFYNKSDRSPVYIPLGVMPDETKVTTLAPVDPASVWNEEKGGWEVPFNIQKGRKGDWIRSISDAKTKVLETGCSKGEVSTWQRQESGARMLSADPQSTNPDAEFVKTLAVTRGISTSAQVEKILAKVNFAVTYGAYVIGMQQHLEDQLKAAATPEDLEAIVWPEDPDEFKAVIDSLRA